MIRNGTYSVKSCAFVLGVLELLQETQHQVSQRGSQRLVVVAHDVRAVLLQLDERVLSLQMQNVPVGRLFNLHLYYAMLGRQGRKMNE